MASYPRKVPDPPSAVTGEVRDWMRRVADHLNGLPTISVFSGLSPNSAVTGVGGNLAVNIGSASTDSRVWVKGGSPDVPSMTGWVVLRTSA